jgi:hypothetical protein
MRILRGRRLNEQKDRHEKALPENEALGGTDP